MKKSILFILLLLGIWALGLSKENSFSQKVILQLLKLVRQYPQEKVYLQTDRDHYEAGDKIWFRAFLTDALDSLKMLRNILFLRT